MRANWRSACRTAIHSGSRTNISVARVVAWVRAAAIVAAPRRHIHREDRTGPATTITRMPQTCHQPAYSIPHQVSSKTTLSYQIRYKCSISFVRWFSMGFCFLLVVNPTLVTRNNVSICRPLCCLIKPFIYIFLCPNWKLTDFNFDLLLFA